MFLSIFFQPHINNNMDVLEGVGVNWFLSQVYFFSSPTPSAHDSAVLKLEHASQAPDHLIKAQSTEPYTQSF